MSFCPDGRSTGCQPVRPDEREDKRIGIGFSIVAGVSQANLQGKVLRPNGPFCCSKGRSAGHGRSEREEGLKGRFTGIEVD